MSWASRLANVFRGGSLDREFEEELQFHVEARAAQLVRDGATPAEAARSAERRLGNRPALRESSRDAKLLPWLESLLRDAGRMGEARSPLEFLNAVHDEDLDWYRLKFESELRLQAAKISGAGSSSAGVWAGAGSGSLPSKLIQAFIA